MHELRSPTPLGAVCPNIGTMLLRNAERHGDRPAVTEKVAGVFCHTYWRAMVEEVLRVARFLDDIGLRPGDRVAIVSGNSYRRLITELAAMASGLVAVPLFAGYASAMKRRLLAFFEVALVVVDTTADAQELFGDELPPRWLCLDEPQVCFPGQHALDDILTAPPVRGEARRALELAVRAPAPDDVSLIMCTSGTTSFPKGVQLTHRNILSQQRALELAWNPPAGLRLLAYLPWHHSFGGLFERFFALYFGGTLAIDDSRGKDVDLLLENFAAVRPQIYFSVPKVYQEIVSRVLLDPTAEAAFFHPELRFVFTAAAPLPVGTSRIFTDKGIPVVEGWGLTETSPCCTLTEPLLDRQSGWVGFPIPGVEIRLGAEDEIEVRGPNTTPGYFRRPDATRDLFTPDGWLRTGDVGAIDPAGGRGLRILSRKDRVLKLSNAEKLFPGAVEDSIRTMCQLVKHAFVFGRGQNRPFALIFPDRSLLAAGKRAADKLPTKCHKPGDPDALAHCLGHCLARLVTDSGASFERPQLALVINRELTLEHNELTPSFKLIPRAIEHRFKSYIEYLENGQVGDLPQDAFVVRVARPGG